jgi:polyisoprenoid-binding protein YceI
MPSKLLLIRTLRAVAIVATLLFAHRPNSASAESLLRQTLRRNSSQMDFNANSPNGVFDGSVGSFTGTLLLHPSDFRQSRITFNADPQSLEIYDQPLQSMVLQQLLQRFARGSVSFSSERIERENGNRYRVRGRCSAWGNSRIVDFPVVLAKSGATGTELRLDVSGTVQDGEVNEAFGQAGFLPARGVLKGKLLFMP